MDESPLHERVQRLEETVSRLAEELERLKKGRPDQGVGAKAAPPPLRRRVAVRAKPEQDPAEESEVRPVRGEPGWKGWSSEDWLQKVGIGLLLFGLAFLFKYSVDQGWLTPAVRIVFGGVLGFVLVGLGFRLRRERHRLSQVLLGGGVATFYITLFAAYQFYGLVPYNLAFVGMGVVTLFALGLALQQGDAVLAVIGTLGGLVTPFLLYRGEDNVPGLVAYTCLLLASASALYYVKGWRTLVWTATIGGWLVFLVAWLSFSLDGSGALRERGAVQAGLVVSWVAFGLVPVVRHYLHSRDPGRWPLPSMKFGAGSRFLRDPAYPLAILTPVVTFLMTSELWSYGDVAWWSVSLGATAFYVVLALLLYRGACDQMAEVHLLVAAVLLAAGWALRLEGSPLLVALVAEAAALHLVSRRLEDRLLGGFAHLLTLGVGLWVAIRILSLYGQQPVVWNAQALSDLFALALALGTSWLHASPALRNAYRMAVHLLFLGWLYREFVGRPSGHAFVSVAWGVYAVSLLVLGFRLDRHELRLTALGTIGLVVGKLFLVDLAKVQAIWRVLLFMGFGAVFLLLSYFLPNLWKPTPEADADEPGAALSDT